MGRPGGAYVWDERFLDYDFGPTHPFSQRSRRLAVRLLQTVLRERGDSNWGALDEVPVASPEYLATFHTREYLDRVRTEGARDYPGFLDRGDTPAFPGCYEAAARIAAGAAWAVATARERRQPTFHPAGGLHHARPGQASGFCIFNDVALAIANEVRAGRRVAYVDLDAHHGDGVMYGFFDSGRVLAIDFHQDGRTLFPGTGFPSEVGRGDGAGLKVNVPLPPGTGDRTLARLFRRLVPPLLRSFRPELLVVQHGADGHAEDPLTQLRYTSRSFDPIDAELLDLGRELCQSRVVITGGGGYRPESVARVLARAGLAALGVEPPEPHADLPASWRAEFETEWGRAAPKKWWDAAPPESGVPTRDAEDALVGSLERALGRKFPSPTAD